MKTIKYTYRGYIVEKNQSIPQGGVLSFEFRNKGETDLFVNGILLQPTDIFKEDQNFGEQVGEPYDIVFVPTKSKEIEIIEDLLNQTESIPTRAEPKKNLVVIEKRYTKF